MTFGPGLPTVRQLLGTNQVAETVIDLAGVTAVDRSGLGKLTEVYTLAAKYRCSVHWAGVSPRLKKMFNGVGSTSCG